MQFDDRLNTVLRSRADGDLARRTQYRQLVDLLGTPADYRESTQLDAASERLAELNEMIPAAIRAEILRDPAVRILSPRLTMHLADQEPAVAAATMARVRFREGDWLELIPQLPIAARGYLRHRDDLPGSVTALLKRLGVIDLVLTEPEAVPVPGSEAGGAPFAQASNDDDPDTLELTDRVDSEPVTAVESQIGALVQRIEAFQRARKKPDGDIAPRLPLNDSIGADRHVSHIDFECDQAGIVTWTTFAHAPMLVGMHLGGPTLDGLMTRRSAIFNRAIKLAGAPPICGHWRVDAAPFFHAVTGAFGGYYGRLRRIAANDEVAGTHNPAADRMRQLLHELRTPVNAIQGFAEIIQQQVFGPSPNEYRALAANIASDAARTLAGFEELDRLAMLETDALDLTGGESDVAAVFARMVKHVAPSLNARGARLSYQGAETGASVALGKEDAERLAWRVVASLGSTMGPGETVTIHRLDDPGRLVLSCNLPVSLGKRDSLFAARMDGPSASLSPGPFGTGFALRLARAETRACEGDLVRTGDALVLSLPLLTGQGAGNSDDSDRVDVA